MLIDQHLLTARTLQELKEKLVEQGYQTYLGRGIAFVNTKNGTKIKGSEIGRDYSLANLVKRIDVLPLLDLSQEPENQKRLQKKRGLHIG